MLTIQQKQITASELKTNYKQLKIDHETILNDLLFTEEQFHHALNVTEETNGYDVWKLRDYLVDKLQEQGLTVYPFSILKTNRWYRYKKTW